jgi:hypothetical protein
MAQADSQNSTAIGGASVLPVFSSQTRRGILGAMAGVALIPAFPARAHSRFNERLIAIMEEYRVTSHRLCEETNRRDEIEFAAREGYPAPPTAIQTSLEEDHPTPYFRDRLEREMVALSAGSYRRQIIEVQIAEFDKWEAECRRVDAVRGVPEADAAYEAAKAAHFAADDKLEELPADNVVIVLAKLYAGSPCGHPDDDAKSNPTSHDFHSSLEGRGCRDLWTMAEREDAVATARVRAILKELYAMPECAPPNDEAV